MSTKLALTWHFGGLISATAGAVLLAGWPAALITLGVWAVAATMFDDLVRKIGH